MKLHFESVIEQSEMYLFVFIIIFIIVIMIIWLCFIDLAILITN